jgi:pimeloyl-ACP methyl ester carboxylesterase
MKARLLAAGSLALVLWMLFGKPTSAQDELPRFEPAVCPIEVPADPPVDCGYLVVPENYDEPGQGAIRLPVLIVRSRSAFPAPDPLLYTGGGPGSSSLATVWYFAESPYIEDRDVIIFEQRGNLYAQPSLVCEITSQPEATQGQTPCLDHLRQQGIDLADYTTANIVEDLHALRQVLDYEEWNLEGISYSTQLMLLTMDRHPQGIRSVILQSVSPPWENGYAHDPEHAVRALNVMFDDCAADPLCAQAYPELEKHFYEVLSRLNAKPVPVDYVAGRNGEHNIVTVTGHTLLGWMVTDAFYGPARPPHQTAYLPMLIEQVWQGNTEVLHGWARDSVEHLQDASWSWGLFLAVNCQGPAAATTAKELQAQAAAYPRLEGYLRHSRELELCRLWDLPTAPPLADGPVHSDIPTLVLAGSYDPITPPEWSRSAAASLPNSYYYEFPSAGHAVNIDNPCPEQLRNRFLHDPASAPDASCFDATPNARFVLPEETLIVPSMYEFYHGYIGYTMAEHRLYLLCENAFPIVVVSLLALGIVWRVRHRQHEATRALVSWWAFALTCLVSALYYSFSLLMRAASQDIAAAEGVALRFGLPARHASLFLMPIPAAILTTVLVVIAVRACLRGDWSLRGRLCLTLLILPALLYTALIANWGWLTALF